MYYLQHWVIDWEKVQTLDDLKRIVAAMNIAFDYPTDVSSIKDLVRLEDKPAVRLTPL